MVYVFIILFYFFWYRRCNEEGYYEIVSVEFGIFRYLELFFLLLNSGLRISNIFELLGIVGERIDYNRLICFF